MFSASDPFWRIACVKSIKCKIVYARLLKTWEEHFYAINLKCSCPWKMERLSWTSLSQMCLLCYSCVGEALQVYRHYLLQDLFLEESRNLKMFSVLWKEQGNLYCGTPLFYHENRHLDSWGFQLTIVLNSVSTAVKLNRKVLSEQIYWHDLLAMEQSSPR